MVDSPAWDCQFVLVTKLMAVFSARCQDGLSRPSGLSGRPFCAHCRASKARTPRTLKARWPPCRPSSPWTRPGRRQPAGRRPAPRGPAATASRAAGLRPRASANGPMAMPGSASTARKESSSGRFITGPPRAPALTPGRPPGPASPPGRVSTAPSAAGLPGARRPRACLMAHGQAGASRPIRHPASACSRSLQRRVARGARGRRHAPVDGLSVEKPLSNRCKEAGGRIKTGVKTAAGNRRGGLGHACPCRPGARPHRRRPCC